MRTDILLRPIVTEKMAKLGEKLNRYAFKVDKKANKVEIKKAVASLYGVKVKDVNTLVAPGKAKQRFTKTGVMRGQKSSFKKAIITLEDGETIDFYSNI